MSNKKILFVCTHNAARSQMAEALFNAMGGYGFSAGTCPGQVNPYVIKVMKELDIDISANRSKSVREFENIELDYVITLCDSADQDCANLKTAANKLHKSFQDPSACVGNDEDCLKLSRKVRDEIKDWLEKEFYNTEK